MQSYTPSVKNNGYKSNADITNVSKFRRILRPRKIDFRTITSVGAKNYGFVSSDARAVSVRKDTFTGRKRARLSVKVAATIYVGE